MINEKEIARRFAAIRDTARERGFESYTFHLAMSTFDSEDRLVSVNGYVIRQGEDYSHRIYLDPENPRNEFHFGTFDEALSWYEERLEKLPSREESRKRALLKTLSDAKAEAEDLGLNLDFTPAIDALTSNLLEFHG